MFDIKKYISGIFVGSMLITTANAQVFDFDYSEDIYFKLSKTDLCICRSGSSTINELISLKVPSILVPLPIASNNHQFYNAKFLENLGSAILIEEKYLESDKTLEMLKNIIKDKNLLKDMYVNLNNIKQLDSNKIIFEEIYQ